MANVTVFDPKYDSVRSVEWDFQTKKDSNINIHPYPARFINEIPRELIRLLKCPSDCCVVDPFCGSGTTLVEAQKAGIDSLGIDLNPIACLISRTSTSHLPQKSILLAKTICENARAKYNSEIEIPCIPNLDHWFKKDIQKAISLLLNEINEIENNELSDFLRVSLSSIIVRVSNQESDTRYASVDKNYSYEDVFDGFISACEKTFNYLKGNNGYADVKVIQANILDVEPQRIDKPVGLVITSPPYPNAYEYWLYHKYRMWWLGYNPVQVRELEIGARPNYHKKNGQTIEDFKKQMFNVFTLISEKLIVGGHICFVIGRSIIKGEVIDNSKIITEIANAHNLRLVVDIERQIAANRKSFNLKYGKIKTEHILIFRKD